MPSSHRCFPRLGEFNMSASTTGSPMTSEVEAAEHAWLESGQLLPYTRHLAFF